MPFRTRLCWFLLATLLWQGMAAAAMVPMRHDGNAPAQTAMPEHCRMAMMAGSHRADAKAASKSAMTMDCCGAPGHCACAALCSAALPPASADVAPLAFTLLSPIDMTVPGLAAAAPPHPFRPPILLSLV